MKAEPDTEMPLAASLPTSDWTLGSIMGEHETPRRSPFIWQNCENEDRRDRLDIKQQAVFDALRLGDTIVDKWKKWHENQGTETPELAYWVKKFGLSHQSHLAPLITKRYF